MDREAVIVAVCAVSGAVIVILIIIVIVLLHTRKKEKIHVHTQELLPNDTDTSKQISYEKPHHFHHSKESHQSSSSSSKTSTESASDSEDEQVEVFVTSDTPFIQEKDELLISQKNNSADVINTDSTIESSTKPKEMVSSYREIKTEVVKKVSIKSTIEGKQNTNRQEAEVTSSTINRPSARKSKRRPEVLNKNSNDDAPVKKKSIGSPVYKPELKRAYSVSKSYNSSVDTTDTGIRNKYRFEFQKCKCEFLKLVVDQPRTRKRRKVSKQRQMLERDIKVILEDPFLRKHLSGGVTDYQIAIPKLRFPHPPRRHGNRSKRRRKSVQNVSKI